MSDEFRSRVAAKCDAALARLVIEATDKVVDEVVHRAVVAAKRACETRKDDPLMDALGVFFDYQIAKRPDLVGDAFFIEEDDEWKAENAVLMHRFETVMGLSHAPSQAEMDAEWAQYAPKN
jgi:hypothetical protein